MFLVSAPVLTRLSVAIQPELEDPAVVEKLMNPAVVVLVAVLEMVVKMTETVVGAVV